MNNSENIFQILKTGSLKEKIFGVATFLASLVILITILLRLPHQGVIMFYCISIAYMVSFVLHPVDKYFNERKYRPISKIEIILIAAVCTLSIAMITSLYLIFMTKNYDLYYSYWIAGIGLLGTPILNDIMGYKYKRFRSSYKEQNPHREDMSTACDKTFQSQGVSGTQFTKGLSYLLMVIVYAIIFYSSYVPSRTITINVPKRPEKILLTLHTRNDSGRFDINSALNKPEVKIEDPWIIDALFGQIENIPLTNIRYIKEFNHMRFRSDQEKYYSIMSSGNNEIKVIPSNDNEKSSLFFIMDLFSDGTLILKEFYDRNFYSYALKLPEDITKKIMVNAAF